MTVFLSFLFSKAGGWAAGLVVFLGALFAAHQKGKSTGVAQGIAQEAPKTAAAKLETQQVIAAQQVQAAKTQTEAAVAVTDAVQEKQNVTQAVDSLAPSAATVQLLSEFARPDDSVPVAGKSSS